MVDMAQPLAPLEMNSSPRLSRGPSLVELTDYEAAAPKKAARPPVIAAAVVAAPFNPLELLAEASVPSVPFARPTSTGTFATRHERRGIAKRRGRRNELRPDDKVLILARFYKMCPLPSAGHLFALADEAGMPVAEVERWFNNRRLLEQWVAVGASPNDVADQLRRTRISA